jgi:galactose oxidase-like protein
MKIARPSVLGLRMFALGALTSAAIAAPPLPKGLALKQTAAPQHASLDVTAGAAAADAASPTFTPLTNPLPDGILFTMLLTDGTVMAQDASFPYMWWKLTPDINGSYANGTWTQLASLPETYSPDAATEAVLADGRVLLIGGEYSNYTLGLPFTLTNQGAIYDPRTDTWSPLAPPPGFNFIGDSPSTVLPDGRFLLGDKLTKQASAFDPHTQQWTNLQTTGKNDFDAEEGWTLLPDGRVMTLDVLDAPKAEAYSAWRQEWDALPAVPVDLHSPTTLVGCIPYGPDPSQCYYPPGEIGPAILRPNGTVFATGSYANADPTFSPSSAAHTAIYNTRTRSWTQGPDFPVNVDTFCYINCGPVGDNAGDEFAVLLPNGRVLVEGVLFGYEFDGTQMVTTVPENVYIGSLTVLPTGEVLFGGYPEQLYASPGQPDPAWAPVIAWVQDFFGLRPGATYRVWGFQFNGLSQAQAFGDEFSSAQNYPLVRITNKATHHVFYARTHDHSTMGVATGDQLVWTNFDVPQQIESGPSRLEVVANGIASQPWDVWVQ